MALRTLIFSLCLLLSLASTLASGGSSSPPPAVAPAAAPITTFPELKEALGAEGRFDDDPSDFDVLFHIIELANLTMFDNGGAPFTLFAPNDAAFIQTAQYLNLVGEEAGEEAAADAIVQQIGKIGPVQEILTTLLKYHTATERLEVNGTYLELQEAESSSLFKRTEIQTLAEGLTIRRGQEGADPLELTDQNDKHPNPKIVVDSDFLAFGGVVHTIDRMLLLYPVAEGN